MISKYASKSYFIWVIALVGAVLYIPFLGNVHLFDWDEINFAENAREMILTKDYFRVQISFEPFWEKPPFFIWLQVLAMKIFGINEFAARFPNAIVGIITLMTIFKIGKKEQGADFALWWVVLYMCSLLPHLYFKSGIMDPTFNLFIFLGVYFLSKVSENEIFNERILNTLLAGFFIGMGVLTKGPVAGLVAGLCMVFYAIWARKWNVIRPIEILLFGIVAILVCFAWFGLETIKNGPWFLVTFIQYQIRLFSTQDAGHGGFLGYHFVVLLLGCFPASIFFIGTHNKYFFNSKTLATSKWMLILFWVVLILFTIVKTKIVHYSSLCYFPLTYIGAMFLKEFVAGNLDANKFQKVLFYLIGGLLGFAVFLLPAYGMFFKTFEPYIQDKFAVANMEADVSWTWMHFIPGAILLVTIVLAGFSFKNNKREQGVLLTSMGVVAMLQMAMVFIVPNIEAFSQRAAIEYFETLKDKDCYVGVLGYKSYAHYFYAQKKPNERKEAKEIEWLLHGNIDKTVYFISKIDRNEQYETMPELLKLGKKNGFVFYKRMPK